MCVFHPEQNHTFDLVNMSRWCSFMFSGTLSEIHKQGHNGGFLLPPLKDKHRLLKEFWRAWVSASPGRNSDHGSVAPAGVQMGRTMVVVESQMTLEVSCAGGDPGAYPS